MEELTLMNTPLAISQTRKSPDMTSYELIIVVSYLLHSKVKISVNLELVN